MSDLERPKTLNTRLTRACIAAHEGYTMLVGCMDIPEKCVEHETLALLKEVLIEAAAYRKENRKPMQGLKLVGSTGVTS